MTLEPSSNSWTNWDLDLEFLDYPEFTTTDNDYLDHPDLFSVSESHDPLWSIEEEEHSSTTPSHINQQHFPPPSCLPLSAFSETSPSTPSTSSSSTSIASPRGKLFPLTDTNTDFSSDNLTSLLCSTTTPSATAPAEPRKRRGRRTKFITPEAKAIKREAFLQRNREAASRCRERKKSSTDRLKDRMTELQRCRARLLEERDALMNEVQAGKAFLLSCGGVCGGGEGSGAGETG